MLKISSIVFLLLTPNLTFVYGISFVTRPENKTFLRGQSFYFDCSTDDVSDSGIDWVFIPFSRPLEERHIVQWHHGDKYDVQPGFTVEHPNNLTSSLIVLESNSSSAGQYCCQYNNGHGEKSCAYAKEINLPQNEVVLAGNGVMLNCAQVQPFRWYRYVSTDLWDDKVIYMGSKMAYDADERYRVYNEPHAHPYDRLDLYISNVQSDLFGTYKCQLPGTAHCAEIIVLDSEPTCNVRLVKKLGVIVEKAELTCSIKITANAEPEMLCSQNTTGYKTQTICSDRNSDVSTCITEVTTDKLTDISCTVKFNPKPLQTYRTCLHASNQPSYTYSWTPSSDELLWLNNTRLFLIAALAASVIIYILTGVWILVLVRRKRHDKKPVMRQDSSESCSTETESLNSSEGKTDIANDVEIIVVPEQNHPKGKTVTEQRYTQCTDMD